MRCVAYIVGVSKNTEKEREMKYTQEQLVAFVEQLKIKKAQQHERNSKRWQEIKSDPLLKAQQYEQNKRYRMKRKEREEQLLDLAKRNNLI